MAEFATTFMQKASYPRIQMFYLQHGDQAIAAVGFILTLCFASEMRDIILSKSSSPERKKAHTSAQASTSKCADLGEDALKVFLVSFQHNKTTKC